MSAARRDVGGPAAHTGPTAAEPRSTSGHPDDGTAGHRRPYRPRTRRTWFLATREYRAYALRELSSVVVGLFVLNLLIGLVCVHRGLEPWRWWVELQRHPLVVAMTVVALLMAVVHATTWFQATPKIIRVRRGQRYVADVWVVLQHYVLLALFALVVVLWIGAP